MQLLLDGTQMKAVDRYNIEEIGIPSLALMERAALAVEKETERICLPGDFVLFVCGRGNNGADGLAAARMSKLRGRNAEVLIWGKKERATEENRLQMRILEKLGVPIHTVDSFSEYHIEGRYRLVVDALFGIGLSRPLEGSAAKIVAEINRVKEAGAAVLAVDIPSGISSETGQVLGTAVKADVTVTFGYEKLGAALYPGTLYAGRQVKADIGFAEPPGLKDEAVKGFLPGERGRLPKRPSDGNKGTFGRVFLAVGSAGMSGAAYLSARAAAGSGAGLVEIYTVNENVPVLQTLLPEAIVTGYCPESLTGEAGRSFGEASGRKPAEGGFAAGGLENPASSSRGSVFVIGPGLSTRPYAKRLLLGLLKERKRRGIPCVLDADALNLLAKDKGMFSYLDEKVILTPHMGEMARLTGIPVCELKADPVGAAKSFYKEHGVVCVLKDARTVVASGKGVYVNLSGNDGMATGGSGDVLSGLLGGLLAGGMETVEAAEVGVYLHGLAGDAAAKRLGRRAMLAGDILESIGSILWEWESAT